MISGTVEAGGALSASTGSWESEAPITGYSYSWQICGPTGAAPCIYPA